MKKTVVFLVGLLMTGSAFASNFCFRQPERRIVYRTYVTHTEQFHISTIRVEVKHVRPIRHVNHRIIIRTRNCH